MYIDRILYPITTLGPGNRLVIWTKGCSKHCENCANPELWDVGSSRNVSVDEVFQIIMNIHKETPIEGVTISGGDPLEQVEDVLDLIVRIKKNIVEDILVYTGYYYKDIKNVWDKEVIDKIENNIGVLIDGPYIDEQNKDYLTLSGSENQNIIFFNQALKDKYDKYIQKGRKIQNVYMGSKLISVGIHSKNND